MSKDQKKTITLDVETVDNWSKTLSYIITTLDFWIDSKEWPINLCYDCIKELSDEIYEQITKHKI